MVNFSCALSFIRICGYYKPVSRKQRAKAGLGPAGFEVGFGMPYRVKVPPNDSGCVILSSPYGHHSRTVDLSCVASMHNSKA